MRNFLLAFGLVCLSISAPAQRALHGTGDPNAQSTPPDCRFDKLYTDDNTGAIYTAKGYPCTWQPVGSGALPAGVTSDGANGLAVTGTVAAAGSLSAPVVTVTGTPTNPTDAATVAYVGSHSAGGAAYSTAFTQVGTNAVIAKNQVWLSWQIDALATPRACWDGSRWVGSFSLWNISSSKWATGFATSPDLVTWTPVSVRTPGGSDYILGNGGIACSGGTYYFSYSHYPIASPLTSRISIDSSTNLTSWTSVVATLSGTSTAVDSRLVVNPNTGNMEVWYVDYVASTPDAVHMQFSANKWGSVINSSLSIDTSTLPSWIARLTLLVRRDYLRGQTLRANGGIRRLKGMGKECGRYIVDSSMR